jgi:hypothetical protein
MAILNGTQALIVPAEAIITVLSESQDKLVYVLHDCRRVQMFEQDIRERGTRLVGEVSLGRVAAG